MNFGERINKARKNKKLSQDSVAKAIGVHAPIIGRYERGEVTPSIEVAVKIAQVLGVSLDYLVGQSEQKIDANLIDRVVELQKLNNKDKEYIIFTLDAMLRDAKARQAYG